MITVKKIMINNNNSNNNKDHITNNHDNNNNNWSEELEFIRYNSSSWSFMHLIISKRIILPTTTIIIIRTRHHGLSCTWLSAKGYICQHWCIHTYRKVHIIHCAISLQRMLARTHTHAPTYAFFAHFYIHVHGVHSQEVKHKIWWPHTYTHTYVCMHVCTYIHTSEVMLVSVSCMYSFFSFCLFW